ncbi:MAG: preprotein translocase subunit SecG [Clostridia bacterium]|jgi:preprotein translocase subunit SecG|nr:preprotein translocase subunit SecG [Clostridia bacterium]
MSVPAIILSVFQIIVSLVLIVVVLMQSSDQQGLSGTIAGGAETFFGKNKGRTIDAVLKKWTAVIAAIFIILSVILSMFIR